MGSLNLCLTNLLPYNCTLPIDPRHGLLNYTWRLILKRTSPTTAQRKLAGSNVILWKKKVQYRRPKGNRPSERTDWFLNMNDCVITCSRRREKSRPLYGKRCGKSTMQKEPNSRDGINMPLLWRLTMPISPLNRLAREYDDALSKIVKWDLLQSASVWPFTRKSITFPYKIRFVSSDSHFIQIDVSLLYGVTLSDVLSLRTPSYF